MSRIELIGINGTMLTDEQRGLVRHCAAVVVSRRHRPLVDGLNPRLLDITPVAAMLDQVAGALTSGTVAVLASGDPLFHGIGRSLINRFGRERVTIHPALSAVQLACARFGLPWDDLVLLSLHGRSGHNLPGRILGHDRVLLLTDHHNSPDQVAASLLAALEACNDGERIAAIRIRVAENLGLDEERLISGTLADIAAQSFAPLNIMLVEQPPRTVPLFFGLRESEIRHSRGLITKDEVRAATLHRLRLPAGGVLWDIGGGSGSISLEAARLAPDLSIYTIEKKSEEQENIRANIRTYAAYNIRLVAGEAPEALADLPAPDRIFIGGSGKRLEAIFDTAAARLPAGGRIVLNAVLPATATTALSCLLRLGFQVTSATLAVTRTAYPEGSPQVFNPITLITGDK
ncbi:precorrin-6y C5,15-methyltransferase (decarboxylating) subunit CbiE [Desulfobulbus alkaliphilus]|uniref:precorrin-6y C5,15-methyltransferase (decarboxylating) subunit CbiE n=1 Tax=Desulfobulbus alkaliphilus TaxID=869814 RepID=UPI001964A5DC|nr:precorrin-6y C5,15-methyltransferase (decarboxylating) subunit CbiE [Desulfobulbus alkaliphilus]MBM9537052.1 precorrin-6y C5,15-methyltransferase (decarboxylating) subunit CbiE [Desulfobulbus alkaliphilus]